MTEDEKQRDPLADMDELRRENDRLRQEIARLKSRLLIQKGEERMSSKLKDALRE